MNMMTVKDEGERRLATYIIFTTFRANPRLRLQNARMKVEVPKHRGVAFKRILIGEKVPIPHIFDARVGECLPLCFFSGLHAFQQQKQAAVQSKKCMIFFCMKRLNRGGGECGLVFSLCCPALWFKLLAAFVPFPVSRPQIDQSPGISLLVLV